MDEISNEQLDTLIADYITLGRSFTVSALTELRDRRAAGGEAVGFEDWWAKDGHFYDPDTSDVPWFDKRGGLADYAYAAGFKASAARHSSNSGVAVKALDPDMPADQLRLHMGEMTAQEIRTARAAIRWANSALQPSHEGE